MASVRRRIRQAVATALAGLPLTGARVFRSRVYPLEAADLPGLLVYVRDESVEAISLPAPRTLERRLQLDVVAVARAVGDLDDLLDDIAEDVEQALAMPCAALAGLAKRITLTSTELALLDGGDQPLGRATLTYTVDYFTTENAPDVAL